MADPTDEVITVLNFESELPKFGPYSCGLFGLVDMGR
jgi:hypothetical protein